MLRPRVEVATGTDPARVVELVYEGHKGCYIANTLNAEILLQPEVVVSV